MADFVPQITVQTLMNTAFISLGFLQVVIALIHKICNVRVQSRNRKPLTRLVLLGAWDSATSENSLLVIDIFMVVYSHMPRYLAEFRYKGVSIVVFIRAKLNRFWWSSITTALHCAVN